MELSQRGGTITISSSAGFSERKMESNGALDASSLMKVTEEYQSTGWEVVNTTNTATSPVWVIYSLLKRAK